MVAVAIGNEFAESDLTDQIKPPWTLWALSVKHTKKALHLTNFW